MDPCCGLRVRFSADVVNDTATIQQWGTPVDLIEIEKTDDGSPQVVTGTGTVVFIDLEGGFYGIVADDGERYLPLDLPADYEKDGLRVRFSADVVNDTATIQQWGTPVKIVEIERTDDGSPQVVTGTGTVVFIDLEGGFYGIIADKGGRYLPLNLNETYRVDGMRLTFVGEVKRDTATTGVWSRGTHTRSGRTQTAASTVSASSRTAPRSMSGSTTGRPTDLSCSHL